MSTERQRTCPSCGNEFSGGMEFRPICKPAVRKGAKIGDVVVGLTGEDIGMGRLIYFMQVDEKVSGSRYYAEPQFANRLDCVYRVIGGRRAQHKCPRYANYDPNGNLGYLKRDIGKSGLLKDASIILSRKFIYFGGIEGTIAFLSHPDLAWLRRLGMSHRRLSAYSKARDAMVEHLKTLLERYPLGYVGVPSHREDWMWYRDQFEHTCSYSS